MDVVGGDHAQAKAVGQIDRLRDQPAVFRQEVVLNFEPEVALAEEPSIAERAAFVAFYVALLAQARVVGAKVFFLDEAHFQADADPRGKWPVHLQS